MNLEQLNGQYLRLKRELTLAYTTSPWNSGRIQRLTDELTRTEREIEEALAVRQGTDGSMRDAA
jgi:hypothetical protein